MTTLIGNPLSTVPQDGSFFLILDNSDSDKPQLFPAWWNPVDKRFRIAFIEDTSKNMHLQDSENCDSIIYNGFDHSADRTNVYTWLPWPTLESLFVKT